MSHFFNKLVFKKLTPGKIVSSKGDKAFKKLEIAVTEPSTPPIMWFDPSKFDLGMLNLNPGTYKLRATVSAPKFQLGESERSEYVEYTVK